MLNFNQPSTENIGAILDVASDPEAKKSVEKALGTVNFDLSNAQKLAVKDLIMDDKIDVTLFTPEQLRRLGISYYTNGNYGNAYDLWSKSAKGDIAIINGVPYEVSGKTESSKDGSGGYVYYYKNTSLKPLGDGKWINITAEESNKGSDSAYMS